MECHVYFRHDCTLDHASHCLMDLYEACFNVEDQDAYLADVYDVCCTVNPEEVMNFSKVLEHYSADIFQVELYLGDVCVRYEDIGTPLFDTLESAAAAESAE